MTIRFEPEAFELLAELERNNRRDWYNANRQRHDQLLVRPFAELLERASAELTDAEWPMSGGRRTMARPLRDQRYAKAAPYRTSVRGLLTSTGRVPTLEGCLHLELDASGGFVATGCHRPKRATIDPIRRRIIDDPERWGAVRRGLAEKGRDLVADRLTKMPSGFHDSADHPFEGDLRLRSIEIVQPLPPDHWLTSEALAEVVRLATDSGPYLAFGNTAIASDGSSLGLGT